MQPTNKPRNKAATKRGRRWMSAGGEVQHNKSRVQGAEKEAAEEGLGHRPHSCNDNRQQLQSKKLNMQNEAIEREREGERGSGERAAVPASQAVIQSGYNYLSPAKGGGGVVAGRLSTAAAAATTL